MKTQFILILFIGTILLQSCATIIDGTSDTIRFESEPPGATVYLDGAPVGKTPLDVKVSRKLNSRDVKIAYDGYEPERFELSQAFNVVSVFNLGNLAFWGIDVLSGAIMEYDQKYYEVQLEVSSDVRVPLRPEEEQSAKAERP